MPDAIARQRGRPQALLRRAAGRPLLRGAYRLLIVAARLGRPARTEGVKAVLDDGRGRVLFVRQTYGDRRAWELPGGGRKRGESAPAAVRREAREEVGAQVDEWRPLGETEYHLHRRRDVIDVFAASWPGGPVVVDELEIADFAWLRPEALPERIGPSTRAALSLLGGRAGGGRRGPSAGPRA